jgi:hypothetical protein
VISVYYSKQLAYGPGIWNVRYRFTDRSVALEPSLLRGTNYLVLKNRFLISGGYIFVVMTVMII